MVIKMLLALSASIMLTLIALAVIDRTVRSDFWSFNQEQVKFLAWMELSQRSRRELIATGKIPESTLAEGEALPSPFNCCLEEHKAYQDAAARVSLDDRGTVFTLSLNWDNLFRAQTGALRSGRETLRSSETLSYGLMVFIFIIALFFSLFVAWLVFLSRLVQPIEHLHRHVIAVMRGRPNQQLKLSTAVTELQEFATAFDIAVSEYRLRLSDAGTKSRLIESDSTILDMQIQALVETSEMPAFVLDVAANIRIWNRHMVALTGVPRARANRLLFSDTFLEIDSQATFDAAFADARAGNLPDPIRCWIQAENKGSVDAELQLSPQINPGVGVSAILVVAKLRNVDEHRIGGGAPGEQQTAQSVDPATEATQSRVSKLARGLSYLESSSNNGVLPAQDAAQAMKALGAGLEWVREPSNSGVSAVFDPGEVVQHATAIAKPKYFEQGVEITESISSAKVNVLGDPAALIVSLNAIIQNAVESMQTYPSTAGGINITTYSDEAYYLIKITDSGSGLRTDVIDHVFDPLVTTKLHEGHVGLGLTRALEVVEAMGGSLNISPAAEQQGSEVLFTLPLAPSA